MDVTAQLLKTLELLITVVKKLEATQGLPEQYKSLQLDYNKKTGYDNIIPPHLNSNEESRTKETAKIFKSVLGINQTTEAESDTQKSRKEALLRNAITNVRIIDITPKAANKLNNQTIVQPATNPPKSSNFFSSLLKGVGFGAIAIGVYQLIKSLSGTSAINIKAVAGVAAVIGVLALTFHIASKDKTSSLVGLGVLVGLFAAVNKLIVPSLVDISKTDSKSMMVGVLGITAAVGGLVALTYFAGKQNKVQMLAGLLGVLGISLILNKLIVPSLMQLSSVNWKDMAANTVVAIAAIAGFGVLIGIVGALVTTGVGAIVAGAGILTLTATAELMGYTAEQLQKWDSINGERLIQQAKGVTALNLALITGIASAGAGVLSNILNFFAEDPVEKYKRFETLDGHKLATVGNAISTLAGSFVVINPNSAQLIADSTEIVAIAILKAHKIVESAVSTDAFSKFIDVFNNLSKFLSRDLENIRPSSVNSFSMAVNAIANVFTKVNGVNATIVNNNNIDKINSLIINLSETFKYAGDTIVNTNIVAYKNAFDAISSFYSLFSQYQGVKNVIDVVGITSNTAATISNVAASVNNLNSSLISAGKSINTLNSIKDKTITINHEIKHEFESLIVSISQQELAIHQKNLELMYYNNDKLDKIIKTIEMQRVTVPVQDNKAQTQTNNYIQHNGSLTKKEFEKSFELLTSNIES